MNRIELWNTALKSKFRYFDSIEQLNEYCESQYSNEFINSKSYEDNVLFVFLYDKESLTQLK